MKKLTVTSIAFASLAVWTVACSPAYQGSGRNVPNSQRPIIAADKARNDEMLSVAHVSSVVRGVKNADGYDVNITVDKIDELSDESKIVPFTLTEAGETQVKKVAETTKAIYSLEAKCIDNCDRIIAILTANLKAAPAPDQPGDVTPADLPNQLSEKTTVAEKEKVKWQEAAVDASQAVEKVEDAGKVDAKVQTPNSADTSQTQAIGSAPETKIKTGIIFDVPTSKNIANRKLNADFSFEQAQGVLKGDIDEKVAYKILKH